MAPKPFPSMTPPNGPEPDPLARYRDGAVSRTGQHAAETKLRVWFETRRPVDATEEVVGLGEYGRTLTVITTETLPDDEDEDEEMEERWTPRFSRRR